MRKLCFGYLILFYILVFCATACLSSKPQSYVEAISDPKEWKKLLRTRTNVLVLYTKTKVRQELGLVFSEASRQLRGSATFVTIDCLNDGKKLCKKNKVTPFDSYILKHYKDGEFHKDYDRRETVQSMVTFLRDPSGDVPWDEDEIGVDVIHINDMNALSRLLKKERSFMMMFYAPWCGFCKRLKPDYSSAATELKGVSVLAAMDVNKPENAEARIKYNITGFPTLIYFDNGSAKYHYEGENNQASIVTFMKNPGKTPEKPKEEQWSETISEVVHLTDGSFHEFLKSEPSFIVMFYAPWCGHCKKMKPEYSEAALSIKEKGISGKLAAVDVTKESKLASEFNIKGYPTLKYFRDGKYQFDLKTLREKEKIVEFMIDPKESPPPPPPEKPWVEVESPVVHLTDDSFKNFLKKKKHVLVMFYAPWCGHCKQAKSEFIAAAEQFVDDAKVEFAAVDCTVFHSLCIQHEVSGYPTFKYFSYYKTSKFYSGGRSESEFVKFISNPDNPTSSSSEDDWGSIRGSQYLHHLTESSFLDSIQNKEALVMFYAPWCGHCKAMKADFAMAAEELAEEAHPSILATIDATVERNLASKYNIKGFPTLKFFRNGVESGDYDGKRISADIVHYMKNPPKDEL